MPKVKDDRDQMIISQEGNRFDAKDRILNKGIGSDTDNYGFDITDRGQNEKMGNYIPTNRCYTKDRSRNENIGNYTE